MKLVATPRATSRASTPASSSALDGWQHADERGVRRTVHSRPAPVEAQPSAIAVSCCAAVAPLPGPTELHPVTSRGGARKRRRPLEPAPTAHPLERRVLDEALR